MYIETLLVHGNSEPDPLYHAVNAPVYLSSTYRQERFGEHGAFAYSRASNPTRNAVEELVAELEGGRFGFAFSSGMTATAAALSVLKSGDEVLVTRNVYGGTLNLLNTIFENWGITYRLVDTSNPDIVRGSLQKRTKAVFLETPSNPLLDIADINAITAIAKEAGAVTIVDNTFLSPYLQRPLALGADIVVESATKYLGGHSDLIAGIAATNDAQLAEKLGAFQKLVGGILQPSDAFLLLRGIKTLSVRLDRQIENARKAAAFLQKSGAADRVYYPGLPNHPGYALNARQSKGPGAMLSFLLNPVYDCKTFFDSLRLITPGASLGGVESLIGSPVRGSHAGFSKAQLEEAGIEDNLVRLSVGIENPEDIIEDLRQAFSLSKGAKGAGNG